MGRISTEFGTSPDPPIRDSELPWVSRQEGDHQCRGHKKGTVLQKEDTRITGGWHLRDTCSIARPSTLDPRPFEVALLTASGSCPPTHKTHKMKGNYSLSSPLVIGTSLLIVLTGIVIASHSIRQQDSSNNPNPQSELEAPSQEKVGLKKQG